MKTVLVCDSLSFYGGAERVIEQILAIHPQADVMTVADVLPEGQRGFLGGRPVTSTFLQRLPGVARYYRSLFPLWPVAVEQLDVTPYDLVLSSHHSVAYGVLTRPGQVHVSYVHSPMRYAWDLQHQYLREAKLERGLKGAFARWTLHRARLWDYAAAQRPDRLVANSRFVAERLRRLHRREAGVVHPPVATEAMAAAAAAAPRDGGEAPYYLTLGRLVPYKRFDLLARAFARTPERRLKIVGDGPDMARIAQLRLPNVEVTGRLPTPEVRRLMAGARAFLFAGIEDFGITAVEAQAAGTPVIAYREGGLAETVRGPDRPEPTGLFFDAQTEAAVVEAIDRFEAEPGRYAARHCVANAARFSEARFRAGFAAQVDAALAEAGARAAGHARADDEAARAAAPAPAFPAADRARVHPLAKSAAAPSASPPAPALARGGPQPADLDGVA